MRALHTAATGMQAIANNLANVSTTGFKATRASFEDLLYQTTSVAGAGGAQRPSQIQLGAGARIDATVRDMRTGSVESTGNALDVAITGRGFLVVEGSDGVQRFTRDGQLSVNAEGDLVHSGGHLLSPGIQIPEDAAQIVIDENGEVSAQYADSSETVSLGRIEVADFVNPGGLRAIGGNLFEATPESGEPMLLDDGEVGLSQYALESSNVDVAIELVAMIEAQRAYELTSKAIQAADESMGVIAGLKP
jgi:flagellar basal-body rod protein FlgG